MPIGSVVNLVEEVRRLGLLTPGQLDVLAQQLLPRFADPRGLARELLQRGWLTSFQINRLFQGRGRELVLGSYLLLEPLGEGGMGTVYKARHQRLDRIDALKIIRPDLLARPASVQRFEREARAAARLSHPHVVTIHDAGEVGGVHFLAMEYTAGTDLARLVKEEGPLPVELACDYVRQAALGLQHAHERGLIHRDIKPSNLLLTGGHTIKLLDLGLARLQGTADPALTESGTVLGTPDFVAPEQARNAKQVDIRADLYSLGCTFYYLLAGRSPFPGESLTEKLLKHQMEEAPPLHELRPEVPPAVRKIVARLMAKNPEDRFQTPAEAAAALAQYSAARRLAQDDTASLPDAAAVPVAQPVAEGLSTGVAFSLRAWRPTRTRWLSAAGVAAAVLALGIVITLVASFRGQSGGAGKIQQLPSGPNAAQAKAHFERGNARFDSKDYDGAITEFSQAIRLSPQYADAYEHRGRAHAAKRNLDQAIADFDQAIRLDPNSLAAYFNRATAHFNKGDYERSLSDNGQVIRLNPRDKYAYFNRGVIYAQKKDHERAIAEFSQAIQIDADYDAAYNNRGTAQLDLNRFNQAIRDFDQAIRVNPRSPQAFNNRGLARLRQGELDSALADLNTCISLDPSSASAYYNRGLVHLKKGNRLQAESDFKRSAELEKSAGTKK